jgi:hypothetical protein
MTHFDDIQHLSCLHLNTFSTFLSSFLVLPSSTYLFTVGVEGFVISCDHNQAHTTVGRTPVDEESARRRDLYLTAQTLYKTNIHAPGGIRTRDTSKRSAADLGLRPRGHWDRPFSTYWLHILNEVVSELSEVATPLHGTALISVVK